MTLRPMHNELVQIRVSNLLVPRRPKYCAPTSLIAAPSPSSDIQNPGLNAATSPIISVSSPAMAAPVHA